MKNARTREWAEILRTTEHGQCRSRLAEKRRRLLPYETGVVVGEVVEVKSFCCLGLGSDHAGVRVRWVEPGQDYEEESTADFVALYGAIEVSGLAPREFIDWLELPVPAGMMGVTSFDLMFDTVGYPIYETDNELTAAQANDAGLTFAQIADMVDYFGVKVTA